MTYLLRDLPLWELVNLRWRIELETFRRFWWAGLAAMVIIGGFFLWQRRKP